MIIYKITNLINKKIYVGFDSKNRKLYYGSGLIIKQVIKKYGKENFKKEILEYVKEDNWQKREKYWIKKLNSIDKKIGYNITEGGEGGDTYKNNPNLDNIIEKISNSLKITFSNPKIRKKLGPSLKKRKEIGRNHIKRKIVSFKNKDYYSIHEASRKENIPRTSLKRMLKSKKYPDIILKEN
jgi:hypothetical protein